MTITRTEPDQGPPGFAEFARARYPALVRLGALLTADAHLGEDLAQQGLLAALRAWPRLHPDGHPEQYARVAMTRLAARAGRRRWRFERPTESLPELPGPDPVGAIDDADTARRMLASLPAPMRLTLVLRYWLDLSEEQTAEAMRCSVGTVKSRTSRALERLRIPAAGASAAAGLPLMPGGRR